MKGTKAPRQQYIIYDAVLLASRCCFFYIAFLRVEPLFHTSQTALISLLVSRLLITYASLGNALAIPRSPDSNYPLIGFPYTTVLSLVQGVSIGLNSSPPTKKG